MPKYEAVIGLEIHAELKTKSKMFCACKNDPFHSQPNENVCPVCLGMPGTLPVMNKQAIEWTILTGLALNCKVGHPLDPSHKSKSAESVLWTKWDRKNYFYPDLPKGYQISQYDLPICYDGQLEINTKYEIRNSKQIQNSNDKNSKRRIGITRIHLEEDTGTLKHPEGRAEVDYSLADFNRAGVPLMELVTEPDLRTAKEAKEFCQKYQLILRTLGVSDANMEKGEMRCEVNISLREIADKNGLEKRIKTDKISLNPCKNPFKSVSLGTKVEIKNLNSFKSVEKAIEYEIERQTEALESGEKIIQQTRGWDEKNQKTYVMRTKETSADYRYFPEPDLPPIVIGGISNFQFLRTGRIRFMRTISNEIPKSKFQNMIDIDEIRKRLPELPEEKVKRYIKEYGLKPEDAEVIVGNLEMAEYFERCIKYKVLSIKQLANWIVNEVPDLSIKSEYLVELVNLIRKGKISGKIAKDILPEIKKGKSPREIIKELGLEQISDSAELEEIIDQIVKENPEVVAKMRSGKIGVLGFLVGQVMSATKGQANPQLVNQMLRKKLK